MISTSEGTYSHHKYPTRKEFDPRLTPAKGAYIKQMVRNGMYMFTICHVTLRLLGLCGKCMPPRCKVLEREVRNVSDTDLSFSFFVYRSVPLHFEIKCD